MLINTRLALIVSLIPFAIAAPTSDTDLNTLAKRNTCALQSAHYTIHSKNIKFTNNNAIDQKSISFVTEQDPALHTRLDLFSSFGSGIPAGTLAWVRLHLHYVYFETLKTKIPHKDHNIQSRWPRVIHRYSWIVSRTVHFSACYRQPVSPCPRHRGRGYVLYWNDRRFIYFSRLKSAHLPLVSSGRSTAVNATT